MKKTTLLAMAIAFLPQVAAAQTFQRVITFGDSLSDNGNLYANFGQPPSPPYNKRFTNGFTFAEYLAGGPNSQGPFLSTGPGSVNYAWGGARNDNAFNSNGPIPSTILQIQTFGFLGGMYGARDVVTYWGGANNIFQADITNPLTAQANVQAAAAAAGIGVGTQTATIAANGAKTIVVPNLPSFGSLPSYSSKGPLGVQLGNFATLIYNTAQSQSLQAAALANPGTNFVQVDVQSLFGAVIANPSAFGFSNVKDSCVGTPTCVFGTIAQQNQFLFWDDVHPTDAAHRLLAAAINDLLFTPTNVANVAVLGEIGIWSRRSSALEMLDKARSVETKGDAIQYFVSLAAERQQRNTNLLSPQAIGVVSTSRDGRYYDYTMGGLRFGGFKSLGNGWTSGLAVSALTGDATAGQVSTSPTSLSIDLTAGWKQGPLFVNTGIGGGFDRFSDYRRKTSIAAIVQQGSTDGGSASAMIEAGYSMPFANVTITPVGRIGYLYANIFDFSESSPIGAVRFASRTVYGLTGAVELRAKTQISASTSLNAMIGYESFLSRSAQAVRGQLINNTALPFATSVAAPVGAGLVFGLGVDANMGSWTAGLNYRGSVGEKSQQAHRGEIRFGMAF